MKRVTLFIVLLLQVQFKAFDNCQFLKINRGKSLFPYYIFRN